MHAKVRHLVLDEQVHESIPEARRDSCWQALSEGLRGQGWQRVRRGREDGAQAAGHHNQGTTNKPITVNSASYRRLLFTGDLSLASR